MATVKRTVKRIEDSVPSLKFLAREVGRLENRVRAMEEREKEMLEHFIERADSIV